MHPFTARGSCISAVAGAARGARAPAARGPRAHAAFDHQPARCPGASHGVVGGSKVRRLELNVPKAPSERPRSVSLTPQGVPTCLKHLSMLRSLTLRRKGNFLQPRVRGRCRRDSPGLASGERKPGISTTWCVPSYHSHDRGSKTE